MDLQHLFYIIGIIFMLTFLSLVILIGLTVFYIRKRIFQLTKMASRPAQTAAEISAGVVEGVSEKIREWFFTKSKFKSK